MLLRTALRSIGVGFVAFLFCFTCARAGDNDAGDPRVGAFRMRPLAEKLAGPRATLETFCFATTAYPRVPELIADAVSCLELGSHIDLEPGAAELLALGLDDVLNDIVPPVRLLPGKLEAATFTLFQEHELRVFISRGTDGLWRFPRETVAQIPALLRHISGRSKSRQAARAHLHEGMEDPTATMISFLDHAAAGDFMSAALRLDLSDIPLQDRAVQGPYLAWLLACTIQRRGFVYPQEVPVEPDTTPYTWSADRSGRIAVERIRQPGGKDIWLFSRTTVAATEAMWRAEHDKLPDVRYAVLRQVVPPPPASAAEARQKLRVTRPEGVPDANASPRRMMKAFLGAMDESGRDDEKQQLSHSFLDMSQFPPEDIPVQGPKRAEMLWAVLRKLRPDLGALPDRWSAPPQTLTGAPNLRVEIVRQADGWRFSGETVAQLPTMYAALGGRDRTEDEHLHGLGNPREALLTFFMAIDENDDEHAARCLDLREYPTSARADIGPVLAFKIKYILDRTIRIYLAEIPTDPDGPQVVLYRGPLGRLNLGHHEDENKQKVWGFTAHTVRGTEDVFARVRELPLVADLPSEARSHPAFQMEPGVWLRLHMPPWLRRERLGLEAYQWLGLVLLIACAWGISAFVRKIADTTMRRTLRLGNDPSEQPMIHTKLRSLEAFVFLLSTYLLLEWLDLPAQVAARIYTIQKLLFAFVITWAGLQWADLGRLVYERTERWKEHRGLGDLLVPFTAHAIKLGVILTAVTFLLYQIGQADALTKFLAGVGIVGLAVSLAAQDSLKNLFGTLLLIGDRSFRIGDRLIVNNQEGVVEQVGFRSTKLRTLEDSLLILPNGMLASGIIDNMGLRAYRRVRAVFSLAVSTPVEKARALRDAVQQHVNGHALADPKRVHVHFQKIGEFGIELEVTAYFAARDLETEKQVRDDVTCEVLRLAKAMEVELRGTKS